MRLQLRYLQVAGAREVLAELVERDAHHAIRGVESLLNTIAVVDINVDVQHALVVPIRTDGQRGI